MTGKFNLLERWQFPSHFLSFTFLYRILSTFSRAREARNDEITALKTYDINLFLHEKRKTLYNGFNMLATCLVLGWSCFVMDEMRDERRPSGAPCRHKEHIVGIIEVFFLSSLVRRKQETSIFHERWIEKWKIATVTDLECHWRAKGKWTMDEENV